MKPAPFEYVVAGSWDEAVAALDGDSRVLAGGQSLVPLMNQRLVRPRRLVDISGIPGLIERRRGALRIGATVRQAALERSTLIAGGWPLLRQAVRHVGHPATRARGTIGGSVVHADPRAELICALIALDARFTLSSGRAVHGPLQLGPGELLTAIEVPRLQPFAKSAFVAYARTSGSFADAAVAVVLEPDRAADAVLGAGRAGEAEAAVRAGASATDAAALAADLVDGDHHRALVAELTRRALVEAGHA
ncbi:FAD binding domain-containing protein [Solirubrobacter phytolaccae]|uniref:FAD binding domain-containing protein n=1 Tax=Solirubrobacter phytolaccae TaxID=1404360 RepID=A0A9X3S9G2_9ACTN|nr:FAD binding domain-containing protein [Solirubrobacter phytolaccae]MDA0179210.1 FAD binding domain-containing protein [Solirubrobacter phytolaccae]